MLQYISVKFKMQLRKTFKGCRLGIFSGVKFQKIGIFLQKPFLYTIQYIKEQSTKKFKIKVCFIFFYFPKMDKTLFDMYKK